MAMKRTNEDIVQQTEFEWTAKELQPNEADFSLWDKAKVNPKDVTDTKVRDAYNKYLKEHPTVPSITL